MKSLLVSLIVFSLVLGTAAAQDRQVDLGISVADGKVRSFFLAVSEYYRIPGKEVVATKERYRLHYHELPVIYFLAARTHLNPAVIIDLRTKGMSWLDITFQCGLTPEIYHVPLAVEKVDQPYGRAYGYYKKYRPSKEWKKIVLSDHEVLDLVNLRFISEHYQIKPEVVIEMRSQGKKFIDINDEVAKAKQKGEQGKDKKDQPGKGKTKNK